MPFKINIHNARDAKYPVILAPGHHVPHASVWRQLDEGKPSARFHQCIKAIYKQAMSPEAKSMLKNAIDGAESKATFSSKIYFTVGGYDYAVAASRGRWGVIAYEDHRDPTRLLALLRYIEQFEEMTASIK